MTFRSDHEGLTIRVDQLEAELATLEGRRRGLDVAIAELEGRTRAALAKRAAVEKWRSVQRRILIAIATPIGLVIGFSCMVGGAPFLVWCGSHHSTEVTLHGRVTAGSLPAGARCTATVGARDGVSCLAELRCDGRRVYSGVGHCDSFGDHHLVEYWDHAPPSIDETPYCLIAQTEHVALVSDPPLRVALDEE